MQSLAFISEGHLQEEKQHRRVNWWGYGDGMNRWCGEEPFPSHLHTDCIKSIPGLSRQWAQAVLWRVLTIWPYPTCGYPSIEPPHLIHSWGKLFPFFSCASWWSSLLPVSQPSPLCYLWMSVKLTSFREIHIYMFLFPSMYSGTDMGMFYRGWACFYSLCLSHCSRPKQISL